jgi:hypothetical protein
MNKLIGVRWGDLKEETKDFLLGNANIDRGLKEGECLFDLTDELTVAGHIKLIEDEYVYIVEDEEIIYNPCEGIISETKKINFEIDEVMTVNEAAEMWGKTEGAIRAAIKAEKFIPGIDYRKAGRITLITREAMEKVYGKLENK